MKTRRLVSTIAYNSPQFLADLLARLQANGSIDWAHWIRHWKEEDEKKDHWHLILQPSKAIDTEELRKLFAEVDPKDPLHPLRPQPFRVSKSVDDWLQYAVHDREYLRLKGQARANHYSLEDVRSTDPDLVAEQWREIPHAKTALITSLEAFAQARTTWSAVLVSGIVPVPLVNQAKQIYEACIAEVNRKAFRAGNAPTHDGIFEPLEGLEKAKED